MRFEHPSLRQGLVGAWCPSLGASGLSLIDRSGRNAHGTLTNMGGQDNWRASGSGVALNFDGTNDYVTASNRTGLSGNASYTLSAWVRVTAGTNGTVANAGGGASPFPLLFRVISPGSIWFSGGGTNCSRSGAFVAGVWTHLSVVYPGTVVRDVLIYSNGRYLGPVNEDNGVGTANVAINWTPTTLFLGSLGGTGTFLNGQLDDIRLYNRALTPNEILLLASRRGIGLQPLPDRAAGLPRKISVNVGGTWRAADAYVNVGGTWKLAQASTNVAGTWK